MKNIFLLIVSFILCINTYAQISENGTPASFTNNTSSYRISETIEIPSKDFPVMDTISLNNLLKKARANCPTCKNDFYSYIKNISINVLSEATSYIQNGVKIWKYSIKAKDAKGIQLYFSSFNIPANGKLYIYNKNRTMMLGAYTEANNTDGDNYALQPILGDEIIIEYNAPLNSANAILTIDEIGYMFNNPIERAGIYSSGASEDCENDVASSYGWGWEKEIRSVACLLVPYYIPGESPLGGICSGALLNNSFQDKKPYFLTAEHGVRDALIEEANPSKFVFVFNYQNINPGYENPLSTTQTVSGCKILTKGTSQVSSDYALLLLNETPPAAYNVCYAGWDYSEQGANFSTTNVGVHHPSGDYKKISGSTFNALVSERADYTGPEANFWRVNWTYGLTENGSSGSPLFNSDHRIIGQLYGGYSNCSTSGPDWYGKFSNSWMDGNFAYFLKTTPISYSYVNTYCPVYNAQCYNGIKDGNETGIDCGGTLCPPCKPTCIDGIKNGNEILVDCGGACNACPPTCYDYIKNQGEIMVDCGGPNCRACVVPDCFDKNKNQNETGIDCGGVCGPCVNFCSDNILNGDEIEVDCGGSCKICDGLITTDAVSNGNFENIAACTTKIITKRNNIDTYARSYGFNSDNKCPAGAWYASHGNPWVETWLQEFPLNSSLGLAGLKTDVIEQSNGIFYQLPTNLDPTAEYTLHYKERLDGNPPVHTLEFYATNGLQQSTSAQIGVPTPLPPAVAAQWKEPTYPFNKYRIHQGGWAETTNKVTPWTNLSFTFTVPTGIYNQIWISAKNNGPNSLTPGTGQSSIVYLDDFVLTVTRQGSQPLNCSQDMTFTNVLPVFAKTQNSITVGSINLPASQTTVLRAGNNVRLLAGFKATRGSNFNARIGTCDEPDDYVTRSNTFSVIEYTHSDQSNLIENSYNFQGRSPEKSDTESSNTINIYPNPAKGEFNLSMSFEDEKPTSCTIYNTGGKEVYFNSFGELKISDEIIQLNVEDGLYLLKIIHGDKTSIKKVVITN